MIELGKFSFNETKFEPNLLYFRFWNFAKKLRNEKMHIFMGKFRNLIQIFNNYEGTKCRISVYKRKILPSFFW